MTPNRLSGRDRGTLAGRGRSRQDVLRLVHALQSLSLSRWAWVRIRGVDFGAQTTGDASEQVRNTRTHELESHVASALERALARAHRHARAPVSL